MISLIAEQGNYWITNNFIWGRLLIPVTALSEVIRPDYDYLNVRLRNGCPPYRFRYWRTAVFQKKRTQTPGKEYAIKRPPRAVGGGYKKTAFPGKQPFVFYKALRRRSLLSGREKFYLRTMYRSDPRAAAAMCSGSPDYPRLFPRFFQSSPERKNAIPHRDETSRPREKPANISLVRLMRLHFFRIKIVCFTICFTKI